MAIWPLAWSREGWTPAQWSAALVAKIDADIAAKFGERTTRIIPPPYFWLGAEAERV